MIAPEVKGWCPGAHRPMESGDGLVVRVRPHLGRLDREQILELCVLTRQFGNGFIDLTNRANLQIRGVTAARFEELLKGLDRIRVLDPDPDLEGRRNILVSPFWREGDLTHQLASRLRDALSRLPEMPAKVGFAVDTGPNPILAEAPADFRFEIGHDGLLLRADGAPFGRPISEETALSALEEMMLWFAQNRGTRRRMAQVLEASELPEGWTTVAPKQVAQVPEPGAHSLGYVYGAAFGQIDAKELADFVRASDATGLRTTPWRLFLLEGVSDYKDAPFITQANDPLLQTQSCAGAPFCTQSSVATRSLAQKLAAIAQGSVHVSGCAKGCAAPRSSDWTLVGRAGRFDLVKNGTPWDEPSHAGLSPEDVTKIIERG